MSVASLASRTRTEACRAEGSQYVCVIGRGGFEGSGREAGSTWRASRGEDAAKAVKKEERMMAVFMIVWLLGVEGLCVEE